MTITALPIIFVDFAGSIAMIVLSILSLQLVSRIKRGDPNQLIWSYLHWICAALTLFAVSRSVGHLLKQVLLFSGTPEIWTVISPISGGFNSLVFVMVAAVTFFFETVWKIYRQMISDKVALQSAQEELVFLNRNLEDTIRQRTYALSHSENKYRRIFEISRDAIMVTTIDGQILDLNPAGLVLFQIHDNRLHTNSLSFQSFFSNEKDWTMINNLVQKDGFVQTTEISLKKMDGTSMLSLISCSLNDDKRDDPPQIHYLIKDIEQRRLIDKQMIQADKLASIGEFSAGIAHEINNPLGIILGYTQLLLRSEDGETERHQDLKTIEKHVQNCKSIVADLLNFARSSKPLKKKEDIHQIIDEVISFIKQHAGGRDGIRVEKSYHPDLPHLSVDSKKIRQVFMNLIMNARHALEKDGVISLFTDVDQKENLVRVVVKDDGQGIAQENLSKIFDPFFTTKPSGSGTGLGLSVSYGIIKNHGGNVFVNSTPGIGSEFTVILPIDTGSEV